MLKFFTFSLALLACSAFGQNKILFDGSQAETAANADWIPDADLFNLCFNPNATVGCGNEANPQRVLTPAQSEITISTVETYWKGALSAFAVDCVKNGLHVSTLPYNGQITYNNGSNKQDLSRYKVFVVCEPNIRFTAAEKTAILNWVNAGGGLLMIGNHAGSDRNNDGWDPPAIWNDLMLNNEVQNDPFGFSFDNTTFTQTTSNVVASANPITGGPKGTVTQFQFNGGTTMTLRPTVNGTVRGLVYKTGSSQDNSNAMVAYVQYGNGRVVAIGDSSPVDDGTGDTNDNLYNGYTAAVSGNHRKLLINAILWLEGFAGKKTPTAENQTNTQTNAVLFPNPSNGKTTLQSAEGTAITRVLVTDLQGKTWLDQPVAVDNVEQLTISTAEFPAGVYLLRYEETTNGWHTEKLVVWH